MGEPLSGSRPDHHPQDDLDRRIRADLDRGLVGADPDRALEALRPAFKRARLRRRAQTFVGGFVAAGVLVAGFGVAFRAIDGDQGELTVAGDPEESTGVSADPTTTSQPLEVTVTSASDGQPVPPSVGGDTDGSGAPSPDADTEAGPVDEESTTTTDEGQTTASVPSATSTSGPTASEPTLIESPCGTVVVSSTGSAVALDEVRPLAGFEEDVKSSGPESIEVSLEGDSGHCELKARLEDGLLVTEVETE